MKAAPLAMVVKAWAMTWTPRSEITNWMVAGSATRNWAATSSRSSRSAIQEERGMLAEQRMVLEQEPVSRIRIDDELSVG